MLVLVATGLLSMVAGCPDPASPPAVCTQAQVDISPCGGDLVGTWKVACYGPLSPDVTLTSPPEITIRFDSAASYSKSATGDDYVVQIPLSEIGPDRTFHAASCADLDSVAASVGGGCQTIGSDCECTYSTSALSQSGTYSTSGDHVTTSISGSAIDSTTQGYCVNGNQLRLGVHVGNFGTAAVFIKQ